MPESNEDVLLPRGPRFEDGQRPVRDVTWALAYGAALALTVILGVYATVNRNPLYPKTFDKGFLSNPSNCGGQNKHPGMRNKKAGDHDLDFSFSKDGLHRLLYFYLMGQPLGMIFLALYIFAPKTMVRLTMELLTAVFLGLGITGLFEKDWYTCAFGLAWAPICFRFSYSWRRDIDRCARLLEVAVSMLKANPRLLLFFIGFKLIQLVLVVLPIYGFILASFANGDVVPSGLQEGRPGYTDTRGGNPTLCCAWQPKPWVRFYQALAIPTLAWTILIAGQLRIFVASGTIAQGCFAVSSRPRGGTTKGTTLRSIKHALGPSAGSICFGALILPVLGPVRNTVERARHRDGVMFAIMTGLWAVLPDCFKPVLTRIRDCTGFAPVMASVNGESFLDAGRTVTEALGGNDLKNFEVWWYPSYLLRIAAFIPGLAAGLITNYIYNHISKRHMYSKQEEVIFKLATSVAVGAIVSSFAEILLDAVKVMYIYYAMVKQDRADIGHLHNEIFQIFDEITVDEPVENPNEQAQDEVF